MRLVELIVRQRTVVVFSCLLVMLAGGWSYFHLGQLEDPEFILKTALVITPYPGAAPAEVEQQVTDVVEKAVQRLDRLDKVRSISRAGVSIVYVDIDDACRGDQMPQIWDELRRKVGEAQAVGRMRAELVVQRGWIEEILRQQVGTEMGRIGSDSAVSTERVFGVVT